MLTISFKNKMILWDKANQKIDCLKLDDPKVNVAFHLCQQKANNI